MKTYRQEWKKIQASSKVFSVASPFHDKMQYIFFVKLKRLNSAMDLLFVDERKFYIILQKCGAPQNNIKILHFAEIKSLWSSLHWLRAYITFVETEIESCLTMPDDFLNAFIGFFWNRKLRKRSHQLEFLCVSGDNWANSRTLISKIYTDSCATNYVLWLCLLRAISSNSFMKQ